MLVGIRSIEQVKFSSIFLEIEIYKFQAKENLGALGWSLSAAEVESIDRAALRVPKQLIQNSFQNN